MPPLFGPSFVPPSEMVMTVFGTAFRESSHPPGANMSPPTSTRCAASEAATIRSSPLGALIRSRRTSVTSTSPFSRRLRHDADVLDSCVFQAVDNRHELLELPGAGAAQVHALVGRAFHFLAHPLLENLHSNSLVSEEDHPLGAKRRRHRDEEAFTFDGAGAAGHGQLDVDASLNHRRGDHEYDEQHEH